jgi:hypothetical protein
MLKQTHPKAFTSQQSQQRVGVFLQSYKSTMMPSSSQPTMHGRTAGLALLALLVVHELDVAIGQQQALDCAALATATLAQPACAAVPARLASATGAPAEEPPCAVACAELWLGASSSCGGSLAALAAFAGAAPAGVGPACQAAADAALATAPRSLAVSGLGCHPTFNDAYELQPAPRNGRAQYATRDGAHFLYWVPSFFGTAAWLLDRNTEPTDRGLPIRLLSSAEAPPTGSAVWSEWCNGHWTNARLRLAPGPLPDAAGCAAALGALAPRLTSTCCGPEDGSGCGRSGAPPAACSVDCAHLWEPHARQCPAAAADMGYPALTAFFGGECGAATAGLAVLSGTATIRDHQTHDFEFEGQSGVHYQVDVRVAPVVGDGGVTATLLWVLPPGATDRSQAVAIQTTVAADKGLSFTAAATGAFTVRVEALQGSGPVAVDATAVGSATGRSPRLVATGSPRPLTVSCSLSHCAFGYDNAAALDGDGSGFDLLLEDVQAGQAYAVLLELPAGQAAAQVSATFYQAGGAAGAAGFEPVASGPLGDWTATPAGHQSYPEHYGCSNEDRSCISYIAASFGVHPGGAFPRFLKGTWVATASGAVLLRLVLNCDVPFYADVHADGCSIDAHGYRCVPFADGTRNSDCASELRLTVTPDAYYDEQPDDGPPSGGSAGDAAAAQQQPISGGVERTDTLVVDRGEVEALALILWQGTPAEQRTLAAPPTVDEMLVSGSEANALLVSLFTVEQQPHVSYPLMIQLDHGTGGTGGGGHRRTQRTGGGDLRVQILTRAPTPAEAQRAMDSIAVQSGAPAVAGPGKGRRRAQEEQADTILRLEAALAERDAALAEKDACAGHRLSPREGEVGEGYEAAQAKEIQELRAALAERDSVVAQLRAELETLRRQLR